MAENRSWLPLVAVGVIAAATIALLFWAVHRAGAAPTVINYREVVSESTLRVLIHDSNLHEQGRQLFLRYCTLCHGINGQGLVGPNLRDDYWLHGSDMQRIVESIANGNPTKGMAPWKPVLSVTELHALAVYVVSLSDNNDTQGKAAEGTKQPITWRTTTP